MQIARLTAKKTRITDVVNGKYFPGIKETMRAAYVITPFGQKVSRVSLIATVTDKFLREDGEYATATVDDGSGAIRVKCFKEGVSVLEDVDVGNCVFVVGKLREYNGELYVNGEVVKKVDDPNYESFRRLEVLNQLIDEKKIANQIKAMANQMPEKELKSFVKNNFGLDEESLQVIVESKSKEVDYKPAVMELIASLDDGKGVEVSKIFEMSKIPENKLENSINELLSSGYLFEPVVGRLKRIET